MLNHFVGGRLKKKEVREGTMLFPWKENCGNTQILYGCFASVFTKISLGKIQKSCYWQQEIACKCRLRRKEDSKEWGRGGEEKHFQDEWSYLRTLWLSLRTFETRWGNEKVEANLCLLKTFKIFSSYMLLDFSMPCDALCSVYKM